ncbi:hypothetical protein ACEN32_02450 [Marinilactibacillus psychrotolerans]|uniref:hypothetical protein n=1 Tax=Marinilactibacillus psychrotolerans TaxID=191770 RepID=UPI003883B5E3
MEIKMIGLKHNIKDGKPVNVVVSFENYEDTQSFSSQVKLTIDDIDLTVVDYVEYEKAAKQKMIGWLQGMSE